jgi:DNA repair exonuclease SbcCD ATPase subunit
MASRIEQQIKDMEDYIEECKYVAFSSSKITVDKDTILGMVHDLSESMPEEIALYRKVINERDKILKDAQKKAQSLVDETTVQKNQMIDEQSVMKEAYAQANEVVRLASQHAQEIEDSAVNDANSYRMAAVQYMDGLLAQLEQAAQQTQSATQQSYGQFSGQLQALLQTIAGNRAELHPSEQPVQQAAAYGEAQPGGQTAQINATESGIPESATATISLADVPNASASATGSLNLDGFGN